MLFSKLYIATTFLAGAFAVPLSNEDKAQPPPIYKHHGYKLVGENKRALLPVNDVVARLERAGLAKRDVVDSEDPVVAAPYSSLLYVLTSDDDHKTGDEDDAAVRS